MQLCLQFKHIGSIINRLVDFLKVLDDSPYDA